MGFATLAAKVAIGAINEEAAHETLDLVERAGGEVLFVRTNVADDGDAEAHVAATLNRFGQLDCAFNNAGFAQPPAPITDLDVSVFDRVISVDLRRVFLCMKHEPLTPTPDSARDARHRTAAPAPRARRAGCATPPPAPR